MPEDFSIHASAVLVGPWAILIRGPSGSGKSQLALALIQAAQAGSLRFARLVADDRALLSKHHGRILVQPVAALAGLIEVRGLGIRRLPHVKAAVLGRVVDLAAADAERLPMPQECETALDGVAFPRLGVALGEPALPVVLAWLYTGAATS
jgi:serine kinase of HPr protein (carbohydrate metabolism regulator)